MLGVLALVVVFGTSDPTASAQCISLTFEAGVAVAQSAEPAFAATVPDRHHDTTVPTNHTHHDPQGHGGIDCCAFGCGASMLPPDGPIVQAAHYSDGSAALAELIFQRSASPPKRPPRLRT